MKNTKVELTVFSQSIIRLWRKEGFNNSNLLELRPDADNLMTYPLLSLNRLQFKLSCSLSPNLATACGTAAYFAGNNFVKFQKSGDYDNS